VAVGGMDGLLIAQYPSKGHDLSMMTAEKTKVLTYVRQSYNGVLAGGKLSEVVVVASLDAVGPPVQRLLGGRYAAR
jgi:predicted regulator of Ras-like GTPase activity (Roadblock/LC7/MglB family)